MKTDREDHVQNPSDPKNLHKFFCQQYNPTNFFTVFYFMEGYLDVTKGTELGR